MIYPVETIFPHFSVGFYPVCHFRQLLRLNAAIAFPTQLLNQDQATFLHNSDMHGNRLRLTSKFSAIVFRVKD